MREIKIKNTFKYQDILKQGHEKYDKIQKKI